MKRVIKDGKVYKVEKRAVIVTDEATGKKYLKGYEDALILAPELDFRDRETMALNPTEKAPSFKRS